MTDVTRQFQDGEVVFREGDESLAVFVLSRGRIKLVKAGPSGNVALATLTKGEMFGEMGILDGVPRNATAIADGRVTVNIIPRHAFLDQLQKDPDLAFQVMSKLIQRLRDADDRLARQASPEPPVLAVDVPALAKVSVSRKTTGPAPKPGLLSRLFTRGKGESPEVLEPQANGPLRVLIASFGTDLPPEATATIEAMVSILYGLPGVVIRRLDDTVAWPDGVRDPEAARYEAAHAAAALLASRGGDVLLWGRIETIGHLLEVHASATPLPHELRLGRMPPLAGVYLPLEAMVEPLPALLRCLVVGAVLAEGTRRGDLGAVLLADVAASAETVRQVVSGFAAAEQAAVLTTWANAAALSAGAEEAPAGLWDVAAQAFEDAGRRLPRNSRLDWADVYIGRALLDCACAERAPVAGENGDQTLKATPWDTAVESLRLALEGIRREERPWDWALLNERLGLMAYRQALANGDEGAFKAALSHYQAAIQVYTRNDYPQKWAEVVSALAQALQVYGDHLGSIPALERAVELCRATVEARPQDTMPLLWATAQNNLGSALFLLAKRRDSADLFHEAADSFRNALTVYQVNGQGRLASVTEKNLARAENACRRWNRRDEKRAQPEWAEGDPAPGDT